MDRVALLDRLADRLLAHRLGHPLRVGVDGFCGVVKVHDPRTDAVVREEAVVQEDAVMLFAATFLQRGALRELWDEVIHLDAPAETAQDRGVRRDADALGGAAAAAALYDSRYTAACGLHAEEERPAERASVLIDHRDPSDPVPVRW